MKTLYSFLLAILGLNVTNAEQICLSSDTIQRYISIKEADSLIRADSNNPNFHILDVRQPDEFKTGFIKNAVNVDYFDANFSALIDSFDKNNTYLLYCKAGSRSGNAYKHMITKKFRMLYCMDGGIIAWIGAGLPFSTIIITDSKPEIENKITVNPIFAKDDIIISTGSNNPNCYLSLYDCSGRVMLQSKLINTITTINVSNFNKGVYFVKVTNNEIAYTKKIFKQ